VTLPGDLDLPRGDREEPEGARRRPVRELPSEHLRRWLRLIGREDALDVPNTKHRPDPTPFEERLERIWTGETTEPGQDG
jgi:hypothetical protein